jgi:hypothetical protein
MRITMRTIALLAALLLTGPAAIAQNQRPIERDPDARVPNLKPTPIPGLTDKFGLDEKKPGDLLDDLFESQAGGISFRPPADSKQVRRSEQDAIAEFANDDRQWLLKVTRASLGQPLALQTTKEKSGDTEREHPGLLDMTVSNILKENPAAEILRKEIVNVGQNGVGIAVLRIKIGSQRFLRQQAIFQVDEKLYFVFNLTTPASKEGRPEDNPDERQAVQTFMAMLDTIQLLDRSSIRNDQDHRLYRTRALYTLWNKNDYQMLKDALIPEQWIRIVHDGKDIGYTYIAEELASKAFHSTGGNVPELKNANNVFDGIMVSVRTRTKDGTDQFDLGSRMFSSLDRKHEDWTHIVNTYMHKGEPAEEMLQTMEFGYSETQLKRTFLRNPTIDPNIDPRNIKDPNLRDLHNPVVENVENYSLRVQQFARGKNANNLDQSYKPAPWYIPQAVVEMLPRILPLNRPVTYLFQSYISDQHVPILRYVDVGFEKEVVIGGRKVHAIPITDRVRLEGTPMIHYMSPEGKYLGSIKESEKLQYLPTDEATLIKLWVNPDLTKPADTKKPDESALPSLSPSR